MKDTHADRIGWTEFGSGCILTGGMCLNKKTKIIIIGAAVLVVVVFVAIAASSSDDYDYESQAKAEIDKYGYDAENISFEIERGTNVFGVSLIKLTGTFESDGETHSFTMTTYTDHELATLEIDGSTFWGDDMGDATYNFSVKEIGPFTYESNGYVFDEEPADGMTFALVTLTVKNVGHQDGLTVTAPEFEDSEGNLHTMDWSATTHHDDSYSNLSYTSLGLGNSATFTMVFEVPDGTVEGGEVAWDSMDLDIYGYVLDPALEPA